MKLERVGFRAILIALTFLALPAFAQRGQQQPGKSIGKVHVEGNLIVMELDEGVLGTEVLFNLEGRTLRFVPEAGGYRVHNDALVWDAQFGEQLSNPQVSLKNFEFPFSGKAFNSFSVGNTGSIAFAAEPPVDGAAAAAAFGRGGRGGAGGGGAGRAGRGGGVTLDRFAQLGRAGATLVNQTPAICAFTKLRMSGFRFAKELADRAVVTWDLTEPYGGIQDFTWTPTVNRFQAVLMKSGEIDLSYQKMTARDGIVGIYPQVPDPSKAADIELAKVKPADGPFPAVYQAFHYRQLPQARDLTCSVLKELGDHYDFLAYYSDFRVDNQEAGTPSNGPRGGGPSGTPVTGIGPVQRGLENYCTQGRFQWQFIQPVYVGSNQMSEYPPEGVISQNVHDVTFYAHEIARRTTNGKLPPYDYAVSQIGHELGHRWGADAVALVNGERIQMGPTHWATGLQAVVPFPFQRPYEASLMGGGVWQDNLDGTFTQLDDDYYVPATGYSYLDLYLMGMIGPEEVPDFFILRNLSVTGTDANGHRIYRADRTKITIKDVIAAQGPREPDVDHAQKDFNTGMVVVVEHGGKPSKELIERTNGIRLAWMDFWTTVTGHRSRMTANPK